MDAPNLSLGFINDFNEGFQQKDNEQLSNFFHSDVLSVMSAYLDMKSLHCLSWTSKKHYEIIRNPFFKAHQWIFQSPYVKKREEKEKVRLFNPSSNPCILKENYDALMKRYFDSNFLKNIILRLAFYSPSQWDETIVEYLPLAVSQIKHPGLLRALFNSYKNPSRFNKLNSEEQQNGLEFVKAYTTDPNLEMREAAIEGVLDAYRSGNFGLNSTNSEIQAEGLTLAEKYASEGSEKAIDFLLDAYCHGILGLQSQDPVTQAKGLELAEAYANKGSLAAIRWLLDAHTYGYFGLNLKDPINVNKKLEYYKKFADQKNEMAISFLLTTYRDGFFSNDELDTQNSKIQIERFELARAFADKGSEEAIEYLLSTYNNGYNGFGLDPKIDNKEVWKLAKAYANKGSEAAIDFLLKAYSWSKDPEIQKEGLKVLKDYADQKSEAAFKHISWLKTGGFGLSIQDGKIMSEKLLNDYANQDSEIALHYLLEPYRNYPKAVLFAKSYANKNSKSALDYLAGLI